MELVETVFAFGSFATGVILLAIIALDSGLR